MPFPRLRRTLRVFVDKPGSCDPPFDTYSGMLYLLTRGMPMSAQQPGEIVRIDARVPLPVKQMLVQAAALEGRSQSDFLIAAVSAAARKVIDEHSIVRLCLADQQILAAALADENRSPSARLQKAAGDQARASIRSSSAA